MFDAALLKHCADPGLKPAIVERFIAAVGSDNPLAISITSGKRVILTTPAVTPDEAVSQIQSYLGHAAVRVGITQFPAGVGATDPAEITTEIINPCTNIKLGTQLFGKVYRIVVKWYGTSSEEAFADAVSAWKTGYFDGEYVFSKPDPGPPATKGGGEARDAEGSSSPAIPEHAAKKGELAPGSQGPDDAADPNKAGIRIDLRELSVRKQD